MTQVFNLILIKPTHYDDDGYVIQWLRSAMPANSLAALYALARDCAERRVLGDNVDIRIWAADETNTRIQPKKLAAKIQRGGGQGMVALVGVQSNQYPRALDLAKAFRKLGVAVCIGGFHVSGCLAMLPDLTPELRHALDLGVSLFAGEAEESLESLLQDAWAGQLKSIYNFMAQLPALENVPAPFLTRQQVKHTAGRQTSFDAGRGCPFLCSFCTIINVQGRKSRHRGADDVERIILSNLSQGVDRFFITDDNFARNRNWEAILDRLIALRQQRHFNLFIQVDTMCHRIPRFIDKAAAAGVKRVFIGLENIDEENLQAINKKQNRLAEYRATFLAWKTARVFTLAGYIVGLPMDTPESVIRCVEIIKRELPVDLLEFFFLTPLPGSEDHKTLYARGTPMDADLNKYDLSHAVTKHDRMSAAEWEATYRKCWDIYYSDEHVNTLMRRAHACGISPKRIMESAAWFYGSVLAEGVHPLEAGILRRKFREDRRPGLPIENPIVFYPRRVREFFYTHWTIGRLLLKYHRMQKAIRSQPHSRNYQDNAITPIPRAGPGEGG
ncbi:B12-binding domain-containing radical SAM protein [Thiorhodovibrio frisius]|uniref:Fe-S oxidoreductase n=1 Tax=Thiorhodovibrio frisius TaxID=631362 RepID=H8Z0N0_9GAMM|nr:radical SAM protein [Thiorhodovibrio frisius]EIC22371.1 Fe-S oxidoreductase [Thiorhodovibrio frisius]WPL24670.1 magnesium-protoporphyrin IX monomethyl ester anaerobic oxidative cyclase [Thiorhodovibrio frisius]